MELMERLSRHPWPCPPRARTLIRRVLELPLPKDSPVFIVGIDEWAWKKGSTYGTILVDECPSTDR